MGCNAFQTIRLDVNLLNAADASLADNVIIEAQITRNDVAELKDSFPPKPSNDPMQRVYNSYCYSMLNKNGVCIRPGQYVAEAESIYIKILQSGDFSLKITILGNFPPVEKELMIHTTLEECQATESTINTFFKAINDSDDIIKLYEHELKQKN